MGTISCGVHKVAELISKVELVSNVFSQAEHYHALRCSPSPVEKGGSMKLGFNIFTVALLAGSITVLLFLPTVIFMVMIVLEEVRFKNTKPDARTILEMSFPHFLINEEFLAVNSERVRYVRHEGNMGSSMVEGGACAIVSMPLGESLQSIKTQFHAHALEVEFYQSSTITRAKQYRKPSSNVCRFLSDAKWSERDFTLLATAGNCEGLCRGDAQEWSVFHDLKSNQVLIEWLDYDGDQASSFP